MEDMDPNVPTEPEPNDEPARLTRGAQLALQRECQSTRQARRAAESERDRERAARLAAEERMRALESDLETARAAQRPPDELEQTKLALRSWRRDAGLARLIATIRPYRPDKVLEVLDDLVIQSDDGELLLADGDEQLPLSEESLRRVIPPELLPPGDGRADMLPGGSGGKKPSPLQPSTTADVVECGLRSQRYYDKNKTAILEALKRREREGGQ